MTARTYPITIEGIAAARRRIAPYLDTTPLINSEGLSRAFGAEVWLKVETMTPVASYKIRGALNALLLAKDAGVRRVATSSTGNHGQGVAYAARLLGLEAEIFVPERPNPVKKAMIEAFGGHIHEGGRDIDVAKERAKAFAHSSGAAFVDDGDTPAVTEGAATVGLEIVRALEAVDALFLPMGSGSLAPGSGAVLKALSHRTRAIAVQAAGAPAMAESFKIGKPVERPVDTLADGLACRVPPRLGFAAMMAFLDEVDRASDAAMLAGVRTLIESAHILVEPAGAAGLAAAWARRSEFAGKRIVIVLTGANITRPVLAQALAGPALFD